MNKRTVSIAAALTTVALMITTTTGALVPAGDMTEGGDNSSWFKRADGAWVNDRTQPDLYNNYECSWIETPALPGLLLVADPTLKFHYKVQHEGYYDASVIAVTVDGGATWNQLGSGLENRATWGPYVTNCLNLNGVTLNADNKVISDYALREGDAVVDLSSVAQGDDFQVRIYLASDYCCIYSGWEITGITVGGIFDIA